MYTCGTFEGLCTQESHPWCFLVLPALGLSSFLFLPIGILKACSFPHYYINEDEHRSYIMGLRYVLFGGAPIQFLCPFFFEYCLSLLI